MPVISGQDAEVPSIKAMLRGEQYSTIFKDTRDLAQGDGGHGGCGAQRQGSPVNDTKTYKNGVKVVPSYLLKPVVVDKSNWEKTLIDSGYYKRSAVHSEAGSKRVSACRTVGRLNDDNAGNARHQQSFAGVQALRDVNFTVRRARSTPWWARTAPASRP